MNGREDREGTTDVVEALDAATRAIAGLQSVDDVLQVIVDQVRPLVGARYAALGIVHPNGVIERFITSGISQETRARIGPLPRGHGFLGLIIRENRSFRIRDIAVDHRRHGFPPHHPAMRSFLGVPITVKGRSVGNLYLTDKSDAAEFSEADERLVRQHVEALFGKQPHCELNPDEVVALGAAVQADILGGGTTDLLLLDVTPLSLGIETMGGVMSSLIRRNTTIPASAKEMFTTYVDGQTGVDIHILQGERELVKDNRSLARFRLKVPPLPAGVPRIEVTFLIDANGILNVSARDVRTGDTQSLAVKPSYGLSDNEVERMIGESFKFAADDLKARQLIEARTEAEIILMATEKALKQGGHLVGKEDLSSIRASMAAVEAAKSGADHKAIRIKMADLEKATHHLAEVLMDTSLKAALENKKLSEFTSGK